jgi:hypothetical protein
MSTSASYYGDFDSDDLPTLNTVSNYITDARTLLQDTLGDTYRYSDASLLVALNVTLLEARRLRADLFVFNHKYGGQPQAFQAVDDTLVDIEPQFRLPILHGLVGHALERDQEDYSDDRASSFLAFFYAGLRGRQLPQLQGGGGPGRP